MKKERVILFPESETNPLKKEQKSANKLQEVWPGNIFRIGQPSSRYFEYIHPVLDPGKMSIKEFKDFTIVEGRVIKIASILNMADGNRIAIFRNYDHTPFVGGIEQIFANIDLGITSGEIMATEKD